MLNNLDFILIFTYIIILLLIGYISGKDNTSSDDFFVANRNMSCIPVALSIAATTISANGFIGGPGWSYTAGLYPFMINIAVPFACFLAIWLVAPIIYHLKIISIYEYLELRFGPKTKLFLVIHFFVNSIIQVSSMVFIPSLFLVILTGWSLKVIVPIIVICAILYTATGGIKAVIWTDVFQLIIIWGSILMIIYIIFSNMNMSFSEFFIAAKKSGKFNAINLSVDVKQNYSLWGTFLGGSILWTRYFAFDQTQVQRILTAKSLDVVKRSIFSSSIIMNVVYFFLLFIGISLFFFWNGKEFANSNQVMIDFILTKIPNGFLGITIIGVFASVMSSVDSVLTSMTTIFIKDIYEVYFNKEKNSTPILLPTFISLIFGVFITIFVIIGFGDSIRSILDTVGKYISYLVGPACAIFIIGLFSKKVNDNGACFGITFGLISGFIVGISINIGWIWNPCFGFLLTILGTFIYEFFFGVDSQAKEDYTYYGIKKIAKFGSLDKYSIMTLIFFISQYFFLFWLR